MVDEFDNRMQYTYGRDFKLQKHCQLFLQCLFSEGGPTKLGEFTAENLCQALVKEVN